MCQPSIEGSIHTHDKPTYGIVSRRRGGQISVILRQLAAFADDDLIEEDRFERGGAAVFGIVVGPRELIFFVRSNKEWRGGELL